MKTKQAIEDRILLLYNSTRINCESIQKLNRQSIELVEQNVRMSREISSLVEAMHVPEEK